MDLCAAPGSWSQVLARRLGSPAAPILPAASGAVEAKEAATDGETGPSAAPASAPAVPGAELETAPSSSTASHGSKGGDRRIVAVDLQEMTPIEGVITLQGDITRQATAERIVELLGGRQAQLVVSDGAPDVTGLHDVDEFVQGQLLLAALNITTHVLQPGGAFVAKVFRGRDTTLLYAQFRVFFRDVVVAKPKASRNSSYESFVVCRGFAPPPGFVPSFDLALSAATAAALRAGAIDRTAAATGTAARAVVPFVACGDLRGFDSDASYPLQRRARAAAAAARAVLDGDDAARAEGSDAGAGAGTSAEPLPPVAPPIHPAYEAHLAGMRKSQAHAV